MTILMWTQQDVEEIISNAWDDGAKTAYLKSAKIAKTYREKFPDDESLLLVLEELFTECASRVAANQRHDHAT